MRPGRRFCAGRRKTAIIYQRLLTDGWDLPLSESRPQSVSASNATVGDFLVELKAKADLKPKGARRIQEWNKTFLATAGNDPVKLCAAKISVDSFA